MSDLHPQDDRDIGRNMGRSGANPDDRDRRLDRLFTSLPRATAPAGFAARVLRRTRPEPRPRPGVWLALAATAAAAIIAAVMLRPADELKPPGAALASERAALEREYHRLAAELEALETLKASARPVVYLGSGPQTDFVLDLERLARRLPAQPAGRSPALGGRVIPTSFDRVELR